MELFDREEECVKLCVCNKHSSECHVAPKDNMFEQLGQIDDFLEQTAGLLPKAAIGQKTNEASCTEWKWDEVKECFLYYVIFYDKKENRIRNQDMIVSPSTTSITLTCSPREAADARILSLYKTDKVQHGLVGIYRARGLKDVNLVIDLSRMTNTNREKKENSERLIHFGFLWDNEIKFEDCTRIAVKRFFPVKELQRIHEQIDLAIRAGGQYTTKYLATTRIEEGIDIWIAMEGCSLGTLDLFIDKKTTFEINQRNVKICFRQILLGLIDMHNKCIIHGKMKLWNILVWPDGKRLKIAEFDQMQYCGKVDDLKLKIDQDIRMTAKMLYKCLKMNSKAKMKADEKCPDVDLRDDFKSLSDVASRKHDGAFSEAWISLLDTLASKCLSGDCDAYLGAYLIMHMKLDKPKTDDILKHPFFWDEHKAMSFITRMDGYLFKAKNANTVGTSKMPKANTRNTANKSGDELNDTSYTTDDHSEDGIEPKARQEMKLLRTVRDRFQNDCKKMCSNISWVETVISRLESHCDNPRKRPALSGMTTKLTKNVNRKYFPQDLTTFLRWIRNVHCHYIDPDVKFFDSDSDFLNFFNNVNPWMMCLLHRALWYERDNAHLPQDLRQFFVTPQFLETLDLLGQ